jgi:hypothetical protein
MRGSLSADERFGRRLLAEIAHGRGDGAERFGAAIAEIDQRRDRIG